MSNIQQYLDEIKKQKQNLVDTLLSQGIDSSIEESLGTIVEKSSNQMRSSSLLPSEKTTFSTAANNVEIIANGTGSIKVLSDGIELATKTLSEKEEAFQITNLPQGENELEIFVEGEISTLDLHNNRITHFTLGCKDKIARLLIYNNELVTLNCSKNQTLRFLHIFNNPLCDNSQYELPLKAAMESLYDRSNTSIGSVVFYPWYGLEVLVEKKSGEWKKYPSAHSELKFEEGQLYGEVVDNEIFYYHYTNGALVPHIEMNRHHSLRKALERDITLSKNWMFGSAILYSDEADKFCYYLRETGVQDVWETAEKGFGICVGTTDFHAGRLDAWEDLNLKAYVNRAGEPTTPWQDDRFWAAKDAGESAQHGDFCLSQMVGRGGNSIFGFAPNAQCYLADYKTSGTTDNIDQTVKDLCDNCQIIASSLVDVNEESAYGDAAYLKKIQRARMYYGTFGQKNPFFVSAGNWGDGLQWSYIRQTGYIYYCNYGTENDVASLDNPSTVIYVASLTPAKTLSNYSGNSNVIDKTPYYTEMTPNDSYIAHYGEVLGWRDDVPKSTTGNEKDGAIGWSQGTSMSCPSCGGTFILMRKIYSKLYPEETNYGKHSPFMDYVKTHWMDPLDNLTSFSVGMGLPCFLAEPRVEYRGANKSSGAVSVEGLKIGQPFDILGTFVENNKNGCAFDYDHNLMAQTGESTFVPVQSYGTERLEVQGYTKNFINGLTAEQKAKNYNEITYLLGAPEQQQFDISQDGKVDFVTTSSFDYGMSSHEDVYFTLGQNDSKNFAMQFIVDLKTVAKAAPISVIQGDNGTVKYSVGNQKLVLINIPNNKDYLSFCLGGLKATSPDDIEFQYGHGTSSSTSFRIMPESNPRTAPTTVGGTAKILHLTEDDVAVLTLCLKETDLLGYYNGNLMFRLPLEFVDVCARDFAIKASMVKDEKIDNAIAYNRVLSQTEIINNSIALLQKLQ